MRIRALSVFEGIVYHCALEDGANPCRPRLEVEAVLRPGDADAEAGPLLLAVADYMVLIGDPTQARRCVARLREAGRITERMGVHYIVFPTWERIDDQEASR